MKNKIYVQLPTRLEKLKAVELQMQADTRAVEQMEVLQNDLETELY